MPSPNDTTCGSLLPNCSAVTSSTVSYTSGLIGHVDGVVEIKFHLAAMSWPYNCVLLMCNHHACH